MSATVFPDSPHDHRRCVADALAAVQSLARDRGEKLTPLRRRVLEIVLESHRPVGAYDILATLARERLRPAPPTVYRALDFLLRQGFVHRIDSRSAFVACFAPAKTHAGHFFLCQACGRVAEIEDAALDAALAGAAGRAGFSAARETVEIAGRCADCANTTSARAGPA